MAFSQTSSDCSLPSASCLPFRVARHLLRKKAKPCPKKAKRDKKIQIVKNH